MAECAGVRAKAGARRTARAGTTSAAEPVGYTIRKRANTRWWKVLEGRLVCLTVYRRGAREVVRRLTA